MQAPINRPRRADTNGDHGNGEEMDALLDIDVSDKEEDDLEEEKLAEEPPAEEDYDPRLFDEQKECAQQPVRGNREN